LLLVSSRAIDGSRARPCWTFLAMAREKILLGDGDQRRRRFLLFHVAESVCADPYARRAAASLWWYQTTFDVALPRFVVAHAPLGLLARQVEFLGHVSDPLGAVVLLVVLIARRL